jgi:glucose/arabinose dehydrogenase
MRVNPDGSAPAGAEKGPFFDVAGGNANLQVMYAYGVRNSYGMDFDPVTSKLWDTENGPSLNDEINVVEPAFNSGWETVMGKVGTPPALVQFGGVGTYSDPEFVWQKTVAPTAIHFLRGNGLGAAYLHACFVGDSNLGKLYRFPMNAGRTGFSLTGDLADGVLAIGESDAQVLAGTGFGGILNMTTGPDGNLYVVTYNTVYRVRSNATAVQDWELYR